MSPVRIFALAAVTFCSGYCLWRIIQIIHAHKPQHYSKPKGRSKAGVLFAFTSALNPARKESAYLHLPTYTAGILYHTGTFTALGLFFLSVFFDITPESMWRWIPVLLLSTGSLAGMAIFAKRIVHKPLRKLSVPDDYISNGLVTLFQIITALWLAGISDKSLFLLWGGIVGFYVPFGKLIHTVYFFAARIYLGLVFGHKGVWPVHKQSASNG